MSLNFSPPPERSLVSDQDIPAELLEPTRLLCKVAEKAALGSEKGKRTNSKCSYQDRSKQSVQPAASTRSRFQKPSPNLGRAIGKTRISVLEKSAEAKAELAENECPNQQDNASECHSVAQEWERPPPKVDENQTGLESERLVCSPGSAQLEAVQPPGGVSVSEIIEQDESHLISRKKEEIIQPSLCLDQSSPLDQDKTPGTKPAVLVRSRFQRPKPNLSRAVVRREASQKDSVETKTEEESHEGKKLEQLKCEPETHSSNEVEAVPSSEVIKDQSPTKNDEVVSTAEILQTSKLKSPERSGCENLEGGAEGSPLSSAQEEALDEFASQKQHSQEENVSTTAKPATLIRRRFQRLIPNLGRSAGKRGSTALGKDAAESETGPTVAKKEHSEKVLEVTCKIQAESSQNCDAVSLDESAPKRVRYSDDLTSRSESQERQAEECHALIPTEELSEASVRHTVKELPKEESKCSTIKPAQLLRGRLQTAKPNLGREAARRETLVLEKNAVERKTEPAAAEESSPKVQQCTSEKHSSMECPVTDQGKGEKEPLPSLEIEKVLPSTEESLLNVLQSPERTSYERREEEASQLITDQEEVAECPTISGTKSDAGGESKPPAVKPAQLLRTRFQKPKPNIGRAPVRKDSAGLKKNAAEVAEQLTLDAVEKSELCHSFEHAQECLEIGQGTSPRQSTDSFRLQSLTKSPSYLHRPQETSKMSTLDPLLKSQVW
ncbi:transcription factor TFIIIB component B'' homolog [Protopterus annectens]|uniref:transcription factor TFIIIB component B'' homolog n=1 Tax=Protopterus annectens TaxID=7888 RepID=UPI001CF9EA44|nr:transcription factor TFIIIB component B'' homolog [Protopterus annectens]